MKENPTRSSPEPQGSRDRGNAPRRSLIHLWRMLRLASVLFVVAAAARETPALAQDQASQATPRQAFLELLDGARLEGKFTVVGAGGQTMQRDDLYSVSTLRPGEGDLWVFEYRMSYGGNEDTAQPLEIPVRVLFPEGTPLLTMTEQEVPGLGTFSVRLVFHGDQYAGMWSNGPVGGHMWGRVVRETPPEQQ